MEKVGAKGKLVIQIYTNGWMDGWMDRHKVRVKECVKYFLCSVLTVL